MGIAQYNRGSRLISAQIDKELDTVEARQSARISGLETKLDVKQASLDKLTAALNHAERVIAEKDTALSSLTAKVEKLESEVAAYRQMTSSQVRLIGEITAVVKKLRAIARGGLSPSRYRELAEDYERSNC